MEKIVQLENEKNYVLKLKNISEANLYLGHSETAIKTFVTDIPFQTSYILIPKSSLSIDKDIYITSTVSNETGKIEKIELTKNQYTQLHLLLKNLKQFKQQTTIQSFTELHSNIYESSLSPNIKTHLLLNLYTINVTNASPTVEHPNIFNSLDNHIEKIITDCHILNLLAVRGIDLTEEKYLVRITKLAADMYEYARNTKNLSSEDQLNFNNKCGVLTAHTSTLFPAVINQKLNVGGPVYTLASNLFMFSHHFFINNSLHNVQILRSLWLYFNHNELHIHAELAAEKGLAQMQHSIEIMESIFDFTNLIFTSLIRQGKYARAHHFMTAALQYEQEATNDQIFPILLNLGFLNYLVGEHDIAIRYFERALNRSGNNLNTYINDGLNCQYEGNTLSYFIRTIVFLGAVYRNKERYSSARNYLECAISLVRNTNDYYELVAYNELAKLELKQGKFSKANDYSEKVLQDFRTLPTTKADAIIIKLTSALELKITEDTEGVDTWKTSMAELSSILGYENFYSDRIFIEENNQYPLKKIEVFKLLMLLHQNDDHGRWFELFSHKAINLINKHRFNVINPQAWNQARFDFTSSYLGALINTQNLNSNVNKILDLLENHYSLEPDKEKSIYRRHTGKSSITKEAQSLALKSYLKQEQDFLFSTDKNTEYIYLDKTREVYNASLYDQGNKTLKIEQKLTSNIDFDSNEVFIRYFIVNEKVYSLVVTSTSKDIKFIMTYAQYKKIVGDSPTNTISIPQSYLKDNWLAEQLLPLDLLRHRTSNKLVIVPDGELFRFPFSMLNISNIDGVYQPLIDITPVVFTTAINSYIQDIQLVKNLTPISIFAAQFDSSKNNRTDSSTRSKKSLSRIWVSYLGTRMEVMYIQHALPNIIPNIGMKEEATAQFLMSSETRASQVLHIATHGYYEPNRPELIGLMTSSKHSQNANFLSLNQLLIEPFRNRLVVLSGCQTMLGKYYKGSGMRSMARGFLTQGAGSVISTLWPVQDRSTAEFMKYFYQNLAVSKNSSIALQQTQKNSLLRAVIAIRNIGRVLS
ncbi:CHAT domain-containing protein [Paraglaciecola aquimarina]|uniref:CHAT domain-containing protein n=1 Tax=Paraglaciecola aquimarina TaxID=1235557 RepID=A0ABU3SS22_9ALTE|nr:CHAT domain-containing protein [Paraglaciecola aquimarina]MDU0352782.1 CHAT domain-containing protein [Paraglaciecola aquimarina]